ncbi:MAG: hypothetical protein QE285_16295 [Aquabacterium sp.]|nr:hypothetical protein [Aquabacterium sp.]
MTGSTAGLAVGSIGQLHLLQVKGRLSADRQVLEASSVKFDD